MILFSSIKWKNLLSTGNVYTEIPLNTHANTLIVGENGAGKSTILDALTFALFGKPYRNINKPNLVNSVNNKECLVELKFSIGDRKYLIRRGIKPSVFEIWIDGEMLDQTASSKDYQDILEKTILKMNYKSFTQIVILGSASFTPFMQLSAADRRAVIEDLLDIQIFSTMNSLVKEKLSTLKELASELNIKLNSVKEKIDLHTKHINEIKKNSNELIESKQAEIRENEHQITLLTVEANNLIDKIQKLQNNIEDQLSIHTKLKKLDSYQVKLETNKSKLEKELQFYQAHDNCPTCKQEIDERFKKIEIQGCKTKITELDVGLKKLLEEQNIVTKRIDEVHLVQKQIINLQSEVSKHNLSVSHIQKRNLKILEELSALEKKESVSTESKEESKKLMEELTTLISKKKQTAEEKQYYDVAAQLLKDGGIKAKIIKQYLPIINKMVNKYLSSMDFFVNFNIDEEFKETIKSRHRDDFSYENFSEGEKQKIDLALLLTWRAVARIKNSVHTNLLILDETFDSSLDSKGTDSLLQILYTMPENTNIFVISHKDQLHDKFAHSYRFEKKQGFSRVVT